MIELHADDWYTVTGRGTIATVGAEQITKPVNVGDRVMIDSRQYEVRGIEVKRGLTDPPVILAYGFVVRPWPPGEDDLLRIILDEYEKARQWDADCHEADNSGNVAGDKLADTLRDFLK